MHDLTLASQFADRLLLLQRGVVVARGAAPDVLTESNIATHYGAVVRVLRDDDGRVVVVPMRPGGAAPPPPGASRTAAAARARRPLSGAPGRKRPPGPRRAGAPAGPEWARAPVRPRPLGARRRCGAGARAGRPGPRPRGAGVLGPGRLLGGRHGADRHHAGLRRAGHRRTGRHPPARLRRQADHAGTARAGNRRLRRRELGAGPEGRRLRRRLAGHQPGRPSGVGRLHVPGRAGRRHRHPGPARLRAEPAARRRRRPAAGHVQPAAHLHRPRPDPGWGGVRRGDLAVGVPAVGGAPAHLVRLGIARCWPRSRRWWWPGPT